MRSWLRPSLRYGSVSTTPLARRAAAIAAASTPSKSIVATEWLRSEGLATYGVAKALASAQPYSVSADWSQRSAAHSSPPFAAIHSIVSAARKSEESAGVLYV